MNESQIATKILKHLHIHSCADKKRKINANRKRTVDWYMALSYL